MKQGTETQRKQQRTGPWAGRWDGGRVMVTKDQELRWVLIRRVGGKRWSFTLDVASERDALAELALFQRDSADYIERRLVAKAQLRTLVTAQVRPTDDHLQAVVTFVGGSAKHQADTRRYLAVWLRELGPKMDLRLVTKSTLEKVLDRHAPAGKHPSKRNKLIVAMLNYCRYLRAKADLDPAQSPGRFLEVQQLAPARRARQRDHSKPVLEATYRHIGPIERSGRGGPNPEPDQSQAVRDCMRLEVLHGLHHTEVMRLAAGGDDTAVRAIAVHPSIKGVVAFDHRKKRDWHYISLEAGSWAAVERLRARRHAPGDTAMRAYLAAAAKRGNVKATVLPSKFRHSFITIGRESGTLVRVAQHGLSLADLGAAAGHKSTRTTAKHYDATRIEDLVVIPVKLVHAEDPA